MDPACICRYDIVFYSTAHPGVRNVINGLSELCHRDVRSIRTCPECFENWAIDSVNYFVKVCSKPHLIVYAKGNSFPFWPAKLMAINGAMANVSFFGDHTQDDVPVNQCILYAQKNPTQTLQTKEFRNALMVRVLAVTKGDLFYIFLFYVGAQRSHSECYREIRIV